MARRDWATSPVNNSQGRRYIRRTRDKKEWRAGLSAPNTRSGVPGAEHPEWKSRAEPPNSRGPVCRGHRQSTTPVAGVTIVTPTVPRGVLNRNFPARTRIHVRLLLLHNSFPLFPSMPPRHLARPINRGTAGTSLAKQFNNIFPFVRNYSQYHLL